MEIMDQFKIGYAFSKLEQILEHPLVELCSSKHDYERFHKKYLEDDCIADLHGELRFIFSELQEIEAIISLSSKRDEIIN
jgi:ATP-dependent helicase/DNAse subunit B